MGKTPIQGKGKGDRRETPSVDLILAWRLADWCRKRDADFRRSARFSQP